MKKFIIKILNHLKIFEPEYVRVQIRQDASKDTKTFEQRLGKKKKRGPPQHNLKYRPYVCREVYYGNLK